VIDPRRARAVFFDAAGTLITVRGRVGAIYAQTLARHGARISSETLEGRFLRAFGRIPPPVFPGADPFDVPRLERAWWRALVAEVMAPALPFERFDACFEELYGLFATARGWELAPGARAILDHLCAEGRTLGIISNFDSRLRQVLRHLGIAPYFRSLTLATEVGAAKPDPALFRAALRLHGLRPGEAIYVGDSPVRDVEGALAAGMSPVLIGRAGGAPAVPPGAQGFASLADLRCWLAAQPPGVGSGGAA
jgi:putative hydrolase of the HAD superfamily